MRGLSFSFVLSVFCLRDSLPSKASKGLKASKCSIFLSCTIMFPRLMSRVQELFFCLFNLFNVQEKISMFVSDLWFYCFLFFFGNRQCCFRHYSVRIYGLKWRSIELKEIERFPVACRQQIGACQRWWRMGRGEFSCLWSWSKVIKCPKNKRHVAFNKFVIRFMWLLSQKGIESWEVKEHETYTCFGVFKYE